MGRHVFKLTLDDGSEALMHYGVKGMKWGEHLFGDYDVVGELNKAKNSIGDTTGKGLDHARSILNGKYSGQGDASSEGGGITKSSSELEKQDDGGEENQNAAKNEVLTDEQVEALAYAVIEGDWGNGEERYEALQDAGYSYEKVQTKVNDIVYGTNDYEQGNNTSGREDREKN